MDRGVHCVIVFNDPNASRLIAEGCNVPFNPAVDVSIARVRDDKIVGGVIFSDYTGASIGIHVASFAPDWIDKAMLWITFDYPFVQLGVNKLFGQVPASNAHALDFDLRLGFQVEHVVKDVFPDGDLILVSMYRDACKWLKMRRPSDLVFGRAVDG